MKGKPVIGSLLLLIIITVASPTLPGQDIIYRTIRWEKERLAPGLVWKHTHTILGDTLKQNINVLVVNTGKRNISIVYNPSAGRRTTAAQAEEDNAIAAVNGGFFNSEGGSVTYIRTSGMIVDSDTARNWPENSNLNGALLIHESGDVFIMQAGTNEWFDSNTQYPDVLVTGPLLLWNGLKSDIPSTSLVSLRHPRTSIGKAGRKKVILLTADGRSDQSFGLTLHELSGLMLALRCREAINLDGGGSTTMWIKGKAEGGVVNMPSDNKLFDHAGARAVSSIITVK